MFEYILQLDVSKLRASEVSQCLLYLDHMQKHNPEVLKNSGDIRQKLNERLTELSDAKKLYASLRIKEPLPGL